MSDEQLFEKGDKNVPNWRVLQSFLRAEGELSKAQALKICKTAIDLLKKEPNLMQIEEPVVIVGDVHGQYYDVCHMLEKAGKPGDINYLFLGDFVDRGIYGTEVMFLLMALKINYP